MAEMMLGFECPYGLVDNYADCENVNKPECAKCMEKAKLISDTMNGLFIGKWISVEDRLPEHCMYVLCCGARGGMFVGNVSTVKHLDDKVKAFQHGGQERYITHWMPLPEPPKEG